MQPKVDTRCNSVWLHLQLVIVKAPPRDGFGKVLLLSDELKRYIGAGDWLAWDALYTPHAPLHSL